MNTLYPYFIALLFFVNIPVFAQEFPELTARGERKILVVKDQPFLILGGELGNSSASDMCYMENIWPKIKKMNLNTLLTPVYWELTEPQEGKFNFELIDNLIRDARKHDVKLVLLWFGSWKNSMSCYAPVWVKKNARRFPRAVSKEGEGQEILSPFARENLEADKKAFVALMNHLRKTDGGEQTVIMVQVENEIGMLPDARDHSAEANRFFKQAVPDELITYMKNNRDELAPSLRTRWESNGSSWRGSWEEIFGKGLDTDEIFMAWYFARYADEVAKAGKEAYPLPMFVNAALNRPGVRPGDYPSGGPLPHLIDIWKAAAPQIDFLSPDFYNPRFRYWNDLYTREDNPLFIPEIRFEPSVGAKAFYAIGHYHAMGFSPFSIESTEHPEEENIGKVYELLRQLSPEIQQNVGSRDMRGVWLSKSEAVDTLHFGDYTLVAKHDHILGWSPEAKAEEWPESGALIIRKGPGKFIIAGTGVVVTFLSRSKNAPQAGISRIDEGKYENGSWKPGRRMNGDQSHQGRHLRIPAGRYDIQQVELYSYK
ncbi:GH35 family beta-galactosidase [Sinomicrobium oceani]|uniref:GH35 family beta-galactosidase n=1 Tax=Sinomicrobium oceani TaxID=1150368 RepID=UPI00227BB7BF|nr:DUF5597 domain-containing protein [Sinomicrobium oceani]